MGCGLIQGNTSSSTRISWGPTSFWIPVMLLWIPHIWLELQEDEKTFCRTTTHPQDSLASRLSVFLTTHALWMDSLSHLVHRLAFFNYPSIFIEGLLWAKQSGDLKVSVTYWEFITKLGWSYAMRVLCWLKGKRSGKERRRRQERGGEVKGGERRFDY